ncbi:hypothetical protein N7X28_26290 [Bacillus sp. SM-B1]|nr:hypothetical protein [Bacillus sp. SM-B1]MDV6039951.1 hypothetical protein [Bacillus sp. SM-B1]
MLQIISGKFFESEELHTHQGQGIFYSNYSWNLPIETCIGTIEAVDSHGDITTYIFKYVNKLEKKPGDILIRTGDSTIIEHMKLLFSFFLKCTVDNDRSIVELNTRQSERNLNDDVIPSKFLDRNFDTKIQGTIEETQAFAEFVYKVIGLERFKYKKLITCIKNYNNALQALNYNFDLAYSMLVYCLEALCQSFDEYNPIWEDYPDKAKRPLDKILDTLDPEVANNIKSILIEDSHLKLQKRFQHFINSNLQDDYFINLATGINNPLKHSEVEQVLLNAYNLRSRYVHSLEQVMKQLRYSSFSNGDVFYWQNNAYLTFKGLVRLTHHIILNFFTNQEYLEKEEYEWESDLPGTIEVQLSEQYWLANTDGFLPEHTIYKINGFLYQLEKALFFDQSLTDLSELMCELEQLMPTTPKRYKIQMFVMYVLYNGLLNESLRSVNYNKVTDAHSALLQEHTIEILLLHSLSVWEDSEGKALSCEEIFKSYEKNKFKENRLNIPDFLECIVRIQIANMFMQEGNVEKFNEWIINAILNIPGNLELQNLLFEIKEQDKSIDLQEFMEQISKHQ